MFKWLRKKNDDPAGPELNDIQESVAAEDDSSGAAEPETEDEKTSAAPQAPAEGEQTVDVVIETLAENQAERSSPESGPDAADAEVPEESESAETVAEPVEAEAEPKRQGFFSRLFGGKTAEPEAGDEADPLEDQAEPAEADPVKLPERWSEDIPAEAPEGLPASPPIEDEITGPLEDEELAAIGEAEEAPAGTDEFLVEAETVVLESFDESAESRPAEIVEDQTVPEAEPDVEDEETPRKGIFAKFKDKLSATRDRLAGRIETLLASVRTIDDDVLDELEELLITADLGVKTTSDLLFKIRGQVASSELRDTEALKQALKKRISEMLAVPVRPLPKVSPLVIMVVGINGVGKTTTIAKLTKRLQGEGKKVLLAAGDTFRSAAVDQLTIWAERLGADIVSQPTGSKSSAVVFDAVTAAQNRDSDVVIIDTAGRLHTKVNLMDELVKIKRVAGKAMEGAPHHTILVLDGNTGQNALLQAQTFNEAVGVDSIIMTKLDGTAKGGVIVAIANELKIPITHVGLGESFDDLQTFDPEAFTEAILSE